MRSPLLKFQKIRFTTQINYLPGFNSKFHLHPLEIILLRRKSLAGTAVPNSSSPISLVLIYIKSTIRHFFSFLYACFLVENCLFPVLSGSYAGIILCDIKGTLVFCLIR